MRALVMTSVVLWHVRNCLCIIIIIIIISDISVVAYCQVMFLFYLPSVTLKKRLEKFDTTLFRCLVKFISFLSSAYLYRYGE